MIIVAGHLRVHPHSTQAAANLTAWAAQQTRQEEGCQEYRFAQDVEDPAVFRVFEIWDSLEHLQAHLQTSHMGEFSAQLPALLAEPSRVVRYDAQGATPL